MVWDLKPVKVFEETCPEPMLSAVVYSASFLHKHDLLGQWGEVEKEDGKDQGTRVGGVARGGGGGSQGVRGSSQPQDNALHASQS